MEPHHCKANQHTDPILATACKLVQRQVSTYAVPQLAHTTISANIQDGYCKAQNVSSKKALVNIKLKDQLAKILIAIIQN